MRCRVASFQQTAGIFPFAHPCPLFVRASARQFNGVTADWKGAPPGQFALTSIVARFVLMVPVLSIFSISSADKENVGPNGAPQKRAVRLPFTKAWPALRRRLTLDGCDVKDLSTGDV